MSRYQRAFAIVVLILAGFSAGETNAESGKLTKLEFAQSKIFPGTTRNVWIYVPAQHDGSKPAPVAAFCDGASYVNPDRDNYVPALFDKLTEAGEMPPTIGVFVNPGVVPAPSDKALPRFNRSYEYDGLGDTYARFLDEELFPYLESKFDIKISKDPNDRLVGGASSGGVCAFNCAWSRPDLFRRVWCTVGTFVGLRGGDELHSLVRKTEAKPLRIFLHDGDQDLNIYAGDWWIANQQMQRALEWMGYEHKFIWDDVPHGRQGEMKYLSGAMKYLWQDWPQPVKTHPENAGERRGNFLLENHEWELVSKDVGAESGLASDANGDVFFGNADGSKILKTKPDGEPVRFAELAGPVKGMMMNPAGKLIVCDGEKREIAAYDKEGTRSIVAGQVDAEDLCVAANGTIYFTSAKSIKSIAPGDSHPQALAEFEDGGGIQLTPDQSQLLVGSRNGRMVTACQISPDDKLTHRQPYFWLHSPYRDQTPHIGGMTVDTDGWLYVATTLGVQICDQAGRVNFIISTPVGAAPPSHLCFGGPDFNWLYATCGGQVYRRKLSQTGARSWEAPVKPDKPRL